MKKNQDGFSLALGLVVVALIIILGGVGWYVWQKNDKTTSTEPNVSNTNTPATSQNGKFADPKKSAHYESNTPNHATTLAAVPVDVVINFNFDLADNSTIKILKDGKDYGTGSLTIDDNKLTMRRKMASDAPDGVYTVKYNACWPDTSCHDGSFEFAINRTLLNAYTDKRNQKEITIKLSDIKFQPMNIRISAGTKVTWINDDDVNHYVNTDSHPAHTHVLSFNSKALARGDSFSYTFSATGAYPYHCSAHAANMTGNIVVD